MKTYCSISGAIPDIEKKAKTTTITIGEMTNLKYCYHNKIPPPLLLKMPIRNKNAKIKLLNCVMLNKVIPLCIIIPVQLMLTQV